VASFFVSRIDSEVDKRIEALLNTTNDPARKSELEGMFGKAAIANAKNAYAVFHRVFSSPEFDELRAQGANVQRVLWASTSTKNPRYPDTLYVDELVGPDTVNTMPPATFQALKDHGRARPRLTEDMEEAPRVITKLGELGIDFKEVTDLLLKQGVELFDESFRQLMKHIRDKRERLLNPR
jgi:transaldolase